MGELHIESMVLGQVGTNTYLVFDGETKRGFVVDPADDGARIQRWIEKLGVVPEAILLTHGHFDHIGAVGDLKEKYDIPVLAQREEDGVMRDERRNLSRMFGHPLTAAADRLLSDGEEFAAAGRNIRVLHTPGHTRGSCCYYLEQDNVLFSGDTLFAQSVGRTDFPTGSMSNLVHAIREKLLVLPESTRVLPGHGPETDIGTEKQMNAFL